MKEKTGKEAEDFLQELRDLQQHITPDMHKEMVDKALTEAGKLLFTVFNVLGLNTHMQCTLTFDGEDYHTGFCKLDYFNKERDTHAEQVAVGFYRWAKENKHRLYIEGKYDGANTKKLFELYQAYLFTTKKEEDADK